MTTPTAIDTTDQISAGATLGPVARSDSMTPTPDKTSAPESDLGVVRKTGDQPSRTVQTQTGQHRQGSRLSPLLPSSSLPLLPPSSLPNTEKTEGKTEEQAELEAEVKTGLPPSETSDQATTGKPETTADWQSSATPTRPHPIDGNARREDDADTTVRGKRTSNQAAPGVDSANKTQRRQEFKQKIADHVCCSSMCSNQEGCDAHRLSMEMWDELGSSSGGESEGGGSEDGPDVDWDRQNLA